MSDHKGLHFLPWDEVMTFGFGVLRFSSKDLWAMTPREFQAAVQGVFGPNASLSPIDRAEFSQLMQRYPDI